MMRGWAIAIVLLGGCDDPPQASPAPSTAQPTATTASRYPTGSWSDLRDDTARGPKQTDGTVAVTRTLIGRITRADWIGVAIRFEGSADDKRVLDWSASLRTASFHLTTPDGTERVLDLEAAPKHRDVAPLGGRTHVVHVGSHGLRQFAGVTRWAEPTPNLLAKSGSYQLRITGELVFEGDEARVPLVTGEHVIEVADMGPAQIPVSDLEGIAARFVTRAEGLEQRVKRAADPIDDVEHNLLFRFRAGDGWIDVAMSPRGGMLTGRRLDKLSKDDPWTGVFTR